MFIHRQNLTETQTRQRRTVQQNKQLFAHFPPKCLLPLTCEVVSSVRIWKQPESGTILSALPSACRLWLWMGWDQNAMHARLVKTNLRPPLPPHVHPIKQFSKKAELAASTCTTMDKTSHLRVCFLVLSKRPLYLLARLVFSV